MNLLRKGTLSVLATLAFFCLICEPSDDSTWFRVFFISKGLALLLGYATYRLCRYWEARGYLPELNEDI